MTEAQSGSLGPLPALRPLGPISPSHFVGMEVCALREVWSAAREPAVLPTTPAAALGTVAHRLLEEAGRGDFSGLAETAIECRWDDLLRAAETACTESWLNRHLVPFAEAVPDFEVRRLQALAAAGALAIVAATARAQKRDHLDSLPAGGEVYVSTPDGRAAGRIDAVAQTPEGPVLKDYKSGAIYGHGAAPRELKPEYVTQLKLYAAIYREMTGVWAVRLEILPIVGPPEEVEFTHDECEALLAHALQLRERINAIISDGAPTFDRVLLLATPTPSACGYCVYRPHCPAYAAAREDQPDAAWPLDVRGTLADLRLLGNGKRLVAISTRNSITYIRGVDPTPGRHPAIDAATPGDVISGYSLRPGGSPTSFVEGRFTTFYRELRASAAGTAA